MELIMMKDIYGQIKYKLPFQGGYLFYLNSPKALPLD